tara:strand:- start:304 stop:489 length:186 start_codon:yes stop_codon:yes gene_type:complete
VLEEVLTAQRMRVLTSEMDYLQLCHHLVQDLASVGDLHHDFRAIAKRHPTAFCILVFVLEI